MAFGLPGNTGSFVVNGAILGGLVTGSNGEFLALPISSTVLAGLDGTETTNEWSRFYLSDSFGDASGSVIMALNYLSASLNASSGDVTGPGSSTDNAIVRFDGTTGKIIQNTTQVVISDAGVVSSSVGATLGNLILNDDETSLQLSGALVAQGITAAGVISSSVGATLGNLILNDDATSLQLSGALVAQGITAAGIISSSVGATLGNLILNDDTTSLQMSGAMQAIGEISGGSLAIGGDEFVVSVDGLVGGGAGGDSYSLAANGQISGANAVIAGTNVSGAGNLLGGGLSVGNGAGTISVAGAFVGSSFQGQSFQGSTFKASSGHISGAVDTSVQFSNTGSAGGNNYKAALLISSSDIINASNAIPFADQIPRMVMQGTGEDGGLADFMISISGGMLQVTQLTYGNALPLVN